MTHYVPFRNTRPVLWERALVPLLDGSEVEVRRTTYLYPSSHGDRLRVRYVAGDPHDPDTAVESYDVAVNQHPSLVLEQRQHAERRLWSALAPHPSVLGFSFGVVDAAALAK